MDSVILINRKRLKKCVEEARREGDKEHFIVVFFDGSWCIVDDVSEYSRDEEVVGWLNLDDADFNHHTVSWMVTQDMYNCFFDFESDKL